jgi:hypothetical protein
MDLEEKKKYISINTNKSEKKLTKEDNIEIGHKIKKAGYDSYMKYTNQGVYINLDMLPQQEERTIMLISDIYNYIYHKIENK